MSNISTHFLKLNLYKYSWSRLDNSKSKDPTKIIELWIRVEKDDKIRQNSNYYIDQYTNYKNPHVNFELKFIRSKILENLVKFYDFKILAIT